MGAFAAYRTWLPLAVFLAAWPLRAHATDADLALPAAAPVVDEYHLLDAGDFHRLDQLVRRIKQTNGVEITIFIPSTLRGLEIEDFSIAVADQWKLGKKKEDKGLLMVVAPKERKMRIEVGYGLEGDLTDAFTRRVLDDGMRPFFKQGRYYEGFLSSLAMIQQKVPLGLQQADVPAQTQNGMSGSMMFFIFFLIVMYIISWISRSGGGGYRRGGGYYGGGGWGGGLGGGGFGGGSSGGSSWGGGGGGFGGGGSSSSW